MININTEIQYDRYGFAQNKDMNPHIYPADNGYNHPGRILFP